MNTSLAPTRSNLMKVKGELAFSRTGHDLLDQKRSILVAELLTLEEAILHMGRLKVGNLAGAIAVDSSITLSSRKVMGVDLPVVSTEFTGEGPFFSPEGTSLYADIASEKYREALELMGRLAELKVSIMRLAREVRKTIRKVNSLEKLVIPEREEMVSYLTSRIEEAERENFVLMKSVKDRMERGGV